MDDAIARLLLWSGRCSDLLASLNNKVYASSPSATTAAASSPDAPTASISKYCGATTVHAPFNLTEPRPKPPPRPEVVTPAPRPRPPPPVHEGPTKEQLAIEAARQQNREAARRKHEAVRPFRLRVLERATRGERVREEVEGKLAAELAVRARARPVPAQPEAEVKLGWRGRGEGWGERGGVGGSEGGWGRCVKR